MIERKIVEISKEKCETNPHNISRGESLWYYTDEYYKCASFITLLGEDAEFYYLIVLRCKKL